MSTIDEPIAALPTARRRRPSVVAWRSKLAHENERLQAELRALRARLASEADDVRRRIERDLHDGAQQSFVAVALNLSLARAHVPDDSEAAAVLDRTKDQLTAGLSELRALARGIHPAIMADRGLEPALLALAGRTPMPVACSVHLPERLPAPAEAAAYFVVAEALTNVVRHASANAAEIRVRRDGAHVVIDVSDDGVGGADPSKGSGLQGLADRIAALDGHLQVDSDRSAGTLVRAEIPIRV
jgi:signal transduction histidine kinase